MYLTKVAIPLLLSDLIQIQFPFHSIHLLLRGNEDRGSISFQILGGSIRSDQRVTMSNMPT